MAAVTIVEIELREGALHAELRLGKEAGRTAHGFGLPHGPEANRIGATFARDIVIVDVVVLLERAEQVELE